MSVAAKGEHLWFSYTNLEYVLQCAWVDALYIVDGLVMRQF